MKEKRGRKWSFEKYHTYRIGVLVVKNLSANEGDTGDARVEGLIPGSGRSLEEEMATTPVFLPGKFHGQRSLAVCSPWGCKELHTTEHTHTHTHTHTG